MRSIGIVMFGLVVSSVLLFAWTERQGGYLHADKGAGYWLGVAGTLVMLSLFIYPLRKRVRTLAALGSVAMWFRLHMILGIIGPAMIILHSNYKLGPLNSMLALLSMLVVVASGLVGRFLHARVHKGLYGHQTRLQDVMSDVRAIQHELSAHALHAVAGDFALNSLLAMAPTAKLDSEALKAAGLTRAAVTRARRRLLSKLKQTKWIDPFSGLPVPKRDKRRAVARIDRKIRTLATALGKAERLRSYERLLRLWHHLHTPLFTILVISVVMHIIAVELY